VSSVIGRGLITLLGSSMIVFLAIHLVPGSFVDIFVPLEAASEVKAKLAESYGLDQPLPVQYARWLGATATGDFGVSLRSRRPVVDELAERIPATLELSLIAMTLSIGIGVPLGILAGLAGRSRAGVLTRVLGAVGLSVPSFVLGSFLVYIFSGDQLGLTVGNYAPLAVDPVKNIRSMILPGIALSVFTVALIMRTTRESVLNVLPELHIGAALARGESRLQVVRRHVLRNAAIPVLTVAAVSGGYLLGGAVIIETIFSIPGMGQYAVTAVGARDYPVVQACVLLGAAAFITLNTLADLAYPLIDPRIKAQRPRM
jgi:peptide/nickel transport system permease protein